VTRLFNKIDKLVSKEFDDYMTTLINNAIEQLTKKMEKIIKIYMQKFNYVKAHLQGDAVRAIEGLPLSERNYIHVISLLQDWFGQTHKLIAAHDISNKYGFSHQQLGKYAHVL